MTDLFSENQPYEPEQRLWIAVICRLWEDLTLRGFANRQDKYKAHHWFQTNGRDFRMVCEMAGMNPDYVHEKYFQKHSLLSRRLKEAPSSKKFIMEEAGI